MELLFIAHHSVFNINSGAALRNNLFVNALSRMGHVDIISFVRDNKVPRIENCDVLFSKEMPESYSCIGGIRSLIKVTLWPENPYSYYQLDKEKEAIIDSYIHQKKYDVIVTRYVDSAIKCGLLKYKDKLVIDADDNLKSVLEFKATQASLFTAKWKNLYKSKRIGQMISNLLDSTMCSFCSNKFDRPSQKTIFLHNTSILHKPVIDNALPNQILFIGSLTFYPNKQGITYFIDNIFPLIKQKRPHIGLRVVGKGEHDFLNYLNRKEGVEAVGRVDDLILEYQKAAVVIIPIYYGAGTSIKFVEALLMNRPIVSSPVGARGFSELCQDGVHYMLANTDEEFANKTIELLSSPSKAKEIADNGYDIAIKNFSQERFIEIVKEAILAAYSKNKNMMVSFFI